MHYCPVIIPASPHKTRTRYYGVPSENYSMGISEFYMSYVDIHSCFIRWCLRYARIHLHYGQLYMPYAYFSKCYVQIYVWHAVCDMLYVQIYMQMLYVQFYMQRVLIHLCYIHFVHCKTLPKINCGFHREHWNPSELTLFR